MGALSVSRVESDTRDVWVVLIFGKSNEFKIILVS